MMMHPRADLIEFARALHIAFTLDRDVWLDV